MNLRKICGRLLWSTALSMSLLLGKASCVRAGEPIQLVTESTEKIERSVATEARKALASHELTGMDTEIRAGLATLRLEAYESETEQAWCFALPAGYEDTNLKITLHFADETKQVIYRKNSETELTATYQTTDTEQKSAGAIKTEQPTTEYNIHILTASQAPTIFLNTARQKSLDYLHSNKENRLKGTFRMIGTDGKVDSYGKLDYVKGRGNDSWIQAEKKSYNLVFRRPQNLLNMGSSKKYVLISGTRNDSLLAYKLTYDLEKEIGMDYAPDSHFVHLYVDGQYLGMYLLTEKIEIGEDRFALEENPEDGDVTGSYILELDNENFAEDDVRVKSSRDISLLVNTTGKTSDEQLTYVENLWQQFEDGVFSDDGYNSQGKYFTEYIDLPSFVNQWLIYELNMEISVNSSVYFYKDTDTHGDGKLHASWPWDMEHSIHAAEYSQQSWFATTDTHPADYWIRLYRHPEFGEAVQQQWEQKFIPALRKALSNQQRENKDGISSLTWYEQTYAQDGKLNSSRWPDSDFEKKAEKIRTIYTERKEFLSQALPCYQLPYAYYYMKDGVLYGVTYDGDTDEVSAGQH